MIRKYFFNSTTACILPNLVIKKKNKNKTYFDVDIIENNFEIDKNSTFYSERKCD